MKLVDMDKVPTFKALCETAAFQSDIAEELLAQLIGEIYLAPTVEAAPVVHGKWEIRYDGTYSRARAYCTACTKHSGIGGILSNQKKLFCPNCGAKMDL